SSTAVRRCRRCASMSSPEIGNDFAPEELDRLLQLGHSVGHEQQAGQRGDTRPLVGPHALADLGRAADQVALLEAARLLAQRGPLQRLEVLVELRALEALYRRLVGAADRAGELRRDVDLRALAPGLRGRPVHVLDAALDLLR